MKRRFFLRAVHFILSTTFLLCIITLYYYGLTNTFNNGVYFISAILFSEAVVLSFNRGRCPLEYVHEKLGDEKEFFSHFVPKNVVPYVIPVVAGITIVGFLVLYL